MNAYAPFFPPADVAGQVAWPHGTAAEQMFFHGLPIAHVVRYQEVQRIARRQREFAEIAHRDCRHDPRWGSAL